jgi:PPOX class probable F420-dependent enzyme
MVERKSPGPADLSPRTGAEGTATTLDQNLVVLACERNVGALATIQGDGRPQLSAVNFTFDPVARTARISVVDDGAIAKNLRRDPRASLFVASPDGWRYAVLEATAELSPVASGPNDDTVAELLTFFRAIRGEDPPNRDDFRAAMVSEHRLVARLQVQSAYGLTRPVYSRPP